MIQNVPTFGRLTPDQEKPVAGTLVRPGVLKSGQEDLTVQPHNRSPKGDWIYRIRYEDGVWRSVYVDDTGGGLIVFVRDHPPPVGELVFGGKKLLIKITKILEAAVVGNLLIEG